MNKDNISDPIETFTPDNPFDSDRNGRLDADEKAIKLAALSDEYDDNFPDSK